MSAPRFHRAPKVAALLAAALLAVACSADADDEVAAPDDNGETTENAYDVDEQPDDASAMLTSPADGDTLSSPVAVEMSAEAVDVVAAGAPAVGEGHLHVIVDVGCVATGELIPGPSDDAAAEGYNHFGDGSTEGTLDLEPGDYELCVQLADGVHRAFGETQVISISVE